MTTQRQVPGGPFVNETATAQRQIPGGPFINEKVAAAPSSFVPAWARQRSTIIGSGAR